MGFFDKLFGSKATETLPEKTAEMVPEDAYWAIVDSSLQFNDQTKQLAYITKELKKLPLKEVVGFKLRTDKLLFDTYTPEMWCAGYVMMGGCSDDAFQYFRCRIISEGRKAYYDAKQDPDSLAVFEGEGTEFDFESFWYVADELFKERTGHDLNDYIDDDNFFYTEGNYPDIEFNWEEEEPESMKKICPKLYEKFWEE